MTFLAVSPRRQLEAALGAVRSSGARHRGDWSPWRCGLSVRLKCDPRHEGRVEAVENSARARVRWRGTGWLSWHGVDELEVV